FFENIIGLIFGSPCSTDNIGGRQNDILVVETDGGLEPVDVLKACGNNFTKLGLNGLSNEIDDVYQSRLVQVYQRGLKELCATCNRCPIRDVCGGGYLPHRYRRSNGFDNPSIYCRDLMRLITHIQGSVMRTMPGRMKRNLGLASLTYEQARQAIEAPRCASRPLQTHSGVDGKRNGHLGWNQSDDLPEYGRQAHP